MEKLKAAIVQFERHTDAKQPKLRRTFNTILQGGGKIPVQFVWKKEEEKLCLVATSIRTTRQL